MRRIILRSHQSLGDVLMLTAAIRDLHLAHPGQFQTDVRTSADAIYLLRQSESFDFVFIDGDHRLPNVREELELLLERQPRCVMIHERMRRRLAIQTARDRHCSNGDSRRRHRSLPGGQRATSGRRHVAGNVSRHDFGRTLRGRSNIVAKMVSLRRPR